mmetsp:Transcript_15007/g.58784  ORF Transcript_15007/g.58784 Transcript_15007/m.58784 type:complete len:884 (-) Transcript_15007:2370-5021(-)
MQATHGPPASASAACKPAQTEAHQQPGGRFRNRAELRPVQRLSVRQVIGQGGVQPAAVAGQLDEAGGVQVLALAARAGDRHRGDAPQRRAARQPRDMAGEQPAAAVTALDIGRAEGVVIGDQPVDRHRRRGAIGLVVRLELAHQAEAIAARLLVGAGREGGVERIAAAGRERVADQAQSGRRDRGGQAQQGQVVLGEGAAAGVVAGRDDGAAEAVAVDVANAQADMAGRQHPVRQHLHARGDDAKVAGRGATHDGGGRAAGQGQAGGRERLGDPGVKVAGHGDGFLEEARSVNRGVRRRLPSLRDLPRPRPALPRGRRAGCGGLPLAEAAADAGLSGGGGADRAECLGLRARLGQHRISRRVRRRVPDVRHRAGVQPAQAARAQDRRVRPGPDAGGADHRRRGAGQCAAGGRVLDAGPQLGAGLAGRAGAGGVDGDELDRHRRQAAGRAAGAGEPAWPAGDGRAAVPGPGRGAAAGADPGAEQQRWPDGRGPGLGRAQGGGAADPAALWRPEADALVAHAGGAAQERRALHAQPAAGHAGPGLADRACRPEPGAGRLRRRHADRRDRIQAPGGDRHPALPRRAARPVLHHHRHEAGLASAGGQLVAGDPADRAAGAGQSGADRRAGAAVPLAHRHGAAHGPVPGAGRRVRLRAADAGRAAAPDRRALGQPGAGQHGAVHARHAGHRDVQQPHRDEAVQQRLADAVRAADHHRQEEHPERGPRHHLRLRPLGPEPRAAAGGRAHPLHGAGPRPRPRAPGRRRRPERGVRRRRQGAEPDGRRPGARQRRRRQLPRHPVGAEDPAPRADPCAPRAGGGAHAGRQRPRKAQGRRCHRGRARGHRGQPHAGLARAGAGGRADAARHPHHARCARPPLWPAAWLFPRRR